MYNSEEYKKYYDMGYEDSINNKSCNEFIYSDIEEYAFSGYVDGYADGIKFKD